MATFFASQIEFRDWLEANHSTAAELLVGFYKIASRKPSMTWSQSVDQALCFGWIDGVTRRINDESYSIRFTPRKTNSIWSAVNIAKIKDLETKGLMRPAGSKAFKKRSESKSGVYAYENPDVEFSPEFKKTFKSNEAAWIFFTAQAPSYQKTIRHWISRAKQEVTRVSRLQKTIDASARRERLP